MTINSLAAKRLVSAMAFSILTLPAHAGFLDQIKQQLENVVNDTINDTKSSVTGDSSKTKDESPPPSLPSFGSGDSDQMQAQSPQASGSLASGAPEATFDRLLPLAIKYRPDKFKTDQFAIRYEKSLTKAGSSRCNEFQAMHRNEVTRERVTSEVRSNMQPIYANADASPASKVFYMTGSGSLGPYDSKRGAFPVYGEFLQTANPLKFIGNNSGTCVRGNEMPAILVYFDGAPRPYLSVPPAQAEKMASNRNLKLEALIEVYKPGADNHGGIVGRIKQLHALDSRSGQLLASWDDQQLASLAASDTQARQTALPSASRNRKPIEIGELEIEGIKLGMNHDQARKALEGKGYKVSQYYSKEPYIEYGKKEGSGERTVVVVSKRSDWASRRKTISGLDYIRHYPANVAFEVEPLYKQVVGRFGQPDQISGDADYKELLYWNWPDVDDAAIQAIMPLCDEAGRNAIQVDAQERKQQRPGQEFHPSYVMEHCPGTQEQMQTILNYLNVPIMKVKVDGRARKIQIDAQWPYLTYKEQLPELIREAEAKKARPKANLDF